MHCQSAVSDRETEQLVEEKVDTFWKGLEGGFTAVCEKVGTVRDCRIWK